MLDLICAKGTSIRLSALFGQALHFWVLAEDIYVGVFFKVLADGPSEKAALPECRQGLRSV